MVLLTSEANFYAKRPFFDAYFLLIIPGFGMHFAIINANWFSLVYNLPLHFLFMLFRLTAKSPENRAFLLLGISRISCVYLP